jgi:hypothetical protein
MKQMNKTKMNMTAIIAKREKWTIKGFTVV